MRGHTAVSALALVLLIDCGARTTLEAGGPTLRHGSGSTGDDGGESNPGDNGASDGGAVPMMPNPPPTMPSTMPMMPNPPMPMMPNPPTSRQIACGTMSCDSLIQDCCVQVVAGIVVTCAPKGQCALGVSLSCSSAANCPTGRVCCLSQPMRGIPSAMCSPACGIAGGGFVPGIQLCGSTAECPMGSTCVPTPLGASTCNPR